MNHYEVINDLIEEHEEMKEALKEKRFWWAKWEKKIEKDKQKGVKK